MKEMVVILLIMALVVLFCVFACCYSAKKNSIDEWYVYNKRITSNGTLMFTLEGFYTRNDRTLKMRKDIVVTESIFKAYHLGQIFDSSDIRFE